ncbi:MAG: glycosyl hydrolase, partial [Clostridium sp.]
AEGNIELKNAEDIGNGLKKVNASIKFNNKDINVKNITLSIVGVNTNYKGNLYIDNIKFGQDESKSQYTKKTSVPVKQNKVTVDEIADYMPKTVKLVDSEATPATADLFAYLAGIGRSGKVIYGHQNDTHWKAMYRNGGSNSDTKDITGSIAGVTGMDVLSLTGHELELTEEEKASGLTLIQKAAQIGKDAYKEGAITTLSQHMPNFELVKSRPKTADGKYDYSGYSPNNTDGNIVDRILPGGDLNEVYTGYLDLVAEYANEMKDENGNLIPIIYRPFHENNGSWFWWGAPFCDTQSFKNAFAYTVHYLKDEKGIHNFLYAYSPNGPFENEEDYLSRYPGDEYIDILAFDMYHDDPLDPKVDQWMNTLKETVNIVDGIAKKKGKLSAVSETGMRKNGWGMPLNSTPDLKWYTHVSDILKQSDMSYLMTWSNFNNTDNYYAPYMADETTGHDLINNLIDFYNDKDALFADRIGDYTKADTKIDEAYPAGFISEPISRSRILKPVKIAGYVENAEGKSVKFNIKNKNGELVESIDAKNINGQWTAEITQELLDKIGATTGTIELQAGDTVVNYINAIFNIKEAEKNPKVVDDFESYLGDSDLLKSEWVKNAGAGCNAAANLSQDYKNGGSYGLAFDYSISTAKVSEGWAGITKPLEADWTGCDQLQLWCRPDGKGQKLVIQITSNGEDFEVYLPELAATTEPQLLKIPFSDFKGKNGGKLDLSKITKMGIWCNTIVPEGHEGSWTVNSTMYFDDIKAVN